MKLLFIGIFIGVVMMMICCNTYSPNNTQNIDDIIKSTIRQSSRWQLANFQDKSPVIELLHQNYAIAYFYALRDVFTDDQIKKAMEFTDAQYIAFKNKLILGQEITTKRLGKLCPKFASGIDLELAKLAGDL